MRIAASLFVLLTAVAAPARPAAPADVPEAARAFAKELLAADPAARDRLLGERPTEQSADLVQALVEAGGELRSANDLAGALAAFEAAKTVADDAALAREGANARREAAHVLSVFGRYAESRAYVEEARRTHQRMGDVLQETRAIINLGILARYTGDLDGALAAYAEARTRAEALGDDRLVTITLNNTGVIHLSRGDLRAALEAFTEGMDRWQNPQAQLTADLLGNLGAVHSSQGNFDLALDYLTRSVDVQEKLGNEFGAIFERVETGGVMARLGRTEEARTSLQQAAALAGKAGAQEAAARAHAYLTRLLLDDGRLEEANVEVQQAVGRARGGNVDALVPILCLQALTLVRLERASAALPVADEALAAAERLDSERHRADAWNAKGLALAALGRDDDAAQAFEQSIRATESQRHQVAGDEVERQRFLEFRTSSYEGLLRLNARRGQAEAALAQAERARARALVEALRGGRTRLDTLLTPQERERQAALREALARAGAQVQQHERENPPDPARVAGARDALRDARRQYEAFRSGMFAAHPDIRSRSGQTDPWRLADTRALLDARTLAVSYAVTDDETYLFALSRSGPLQLRTLPVGRQALEERTRRFREGLAARDLGVRGEARRLCETLLGPLRRELPSYDRLLVVPDGPLWELPFQALECRPGRYLLEDRAVSYAPSFTALLEMSRRESRGGATRELLALGDPLLDDGRRRQVASLHRGADLGPLPEAADEVRALGRLYGAGSVVYVGQEAREQRVKAEAGRHRLLHFAAHGLLNDASPLYSQLVLARPAPGEAEDGLLEAWEIMEMDLRADVAVLSACETGRGRAGRGEGLIGLSWAFAVAGCPTTVVSQWKVDSRSTSKLMIEFHGRLARGRSAADALRAAALAVKADRRYAHPFYWAGFIVMGPGRAGADGGLTPPAAVR
jgi:CHAT domain-containing protein